MRSDFANTKGLSGLGSLDTDNWLIDTYYNKLRITGKHPGPPFSIDIEIYTDSNEEWLQVTCPDLFVVVKSANTGQVYAAKYVSSHRGWPSCEGQSTLIFNSSFNAASAELLKIEIYEDYIESLDEATNATPKAVSPTFRLSNKSVINAPTNDFFDSLTGKNGTGLLGGVNGILNKVIIIGGTGAGIYLFATHFDDIKSGFEKIKNNFDNADEESAVGILKRSSNVAKQKAHKALKKAENK